MNPLYDNLTKLKELSQWMFGQECPLQCVEQKFQGGFKVRARRIDWVTHYHLLIFSPNILNLVFYGFIPITTFLPTTLSQIIKNLILNFNYFSRIIIQSNLCATTNLGTPKKWSLWSLFGDSIFQFFFQHLGQIHFLQF